MIAHRIVLQKPWHMYVCTVCEASWVAKDRRHWWPIRLKWAKPLPYGMHAQWFKTHEWETGLDRWHRRWFGWTLHFGRLKVCFGPQRRTDWLGWICPECGAE